MLDAFPVSDYDNVAKTESLKIGLIELPDFLQTRALAMQVAKNEIILARHHSWADRLDDSIVAVLELSLARVRPQLSTVETSDVACRLALRFDRFHAAERGEVLVSGHYSLEVNGATIRREFDVSRVLSVGGYANAVSELRLALNDLAGGLDKAITSAGGCVPKSQE